VTASDIAAPIRRFGRRGASDLLQSASLIRRLRSGLPVPAKNLVQIEIIDLIKSCRQCSPPMFTRLLSALVSRFSRFRTRTALPVEVLALRHLLTGLEWSQRDRLCLDSTDRRLWVWLSRFWSHWRSTILPSAETQCSSVVRASQDRPRSQRPGCSAGGGSKERTTGPSLATTPAESDTRGQRPGRSTYEELDLGSPSC
jgi:hypothetical protein